MENLTGSLGAPVRDRTVKFFSFVGLLGIFGKKISGAKNLKLGEILGGSQNLIFPKYLDLGIKIAKKTVSHFLLNLVSHCLARLYENPFDKSLRALQSKWTTLIFFGSVPPPHPNSVEGHFPGISCARRALSSGIKIVTQGLPNFDKIWGKIFIFCPLAAERRTVLGANSAELGQITHSLSSANFVEIGRSTAEIFEVKRKSDFPVQQ